MEVLRMNPAATALVGDRIHDIEGGRHNGIVTIGAAWGYGSSEELAHASHICDTPLEVAPLLSS